MARVAPRVYLTSADIARLESIATQLPQDARVMVTLEDGRQLSGMVSAMPTVQAFFDPRGVEGMNALVRLDDCASDARFDAEAGTRPPGVHDLWLDEISAVARLPNPSPAEASTRTHPPDPNAPAVR